jgi:hypothetical protein
LPKLLKKRWSPLDGWSRRRQTPEDGEKPERKTKHQFVRMTKRFLDHDGERKTINFLFYFNQ